MVRASWLLIGKLIKVTFNGIPPARPEPADSAIAMRSIHARLHTLGHRAQDWKAIFRFHTVRAENFPR